jgi:hypothetical protein
LVLAHDVFESQATGESCGRSKGATKDAVWPARKQAVEIGQFTPARRELASASTIAFWPVVIVCMGAQLERLIDSAWRNETPWFSGTGGAFFW